MRRPKRFGELSSQATPTTATKNSLLTTIALTSWSFALEAKIQRQRSLNDIEPRTTYLSTTLQPQGALTSALSLQDYRIHALLGDMRSSHCIPASVVEQYHAASER